MVILLTVDYWHILGYSSDYLKSWKVNPSIPGVITTTVPVGIRMIGTSSMTLMGGVPEVGGVPDVDCVPVDLV